MKNEALQKELKDLLQDRFVTSDSVLNNFSKGEDAYDPVKPQAVVFPKTNEEVSSISTYDDLKKVITKMSHSNGIKIISNK